MNNIPEDVMQAARAGLRLLRHRVRAAEADAERLAEALRDVDTWLSEPVDGEDLNVARHQVRLALAAHEALKGNDG